MCCNLAIFISLFDYYVCRIANSAWTRMNGKKREKWESFEGSPDDLFALCTDWQRFFFISFSLFYRYLLRAFGAVVISSHNINHFLLSPVEL